jgi:dihydrofolate reductase
MVSLIAAISQNNCIGKNGTLPWHIPEDMAHFRNITRGKPVIMGRNTWESLPERFRPLPGRKNIVITRQTAYTVPNGVLVYHSLEDAIASQANVPEIMIIGGAQLYAEALPIADRLYITHVPMHVVGDTFFPKIDMRIWRMSTSHVSKQVTFVVYDRSK